MVLIPLSGKKAAGRSATVADDVATEVLKYRWHCSAGYAARTENYRRTDGRRAAHTIFMHHEVWRLAGRTIPAGHELDHINGDRLDDRIANLRPATRSQNHANEKIRKSGTSQYKGVGWHKAAGKWEARIKHNGKLIWLGYFDDEPDAGQAYDTAARRLFGEYAKCNFPIEKEINNV